ncbi:hypothetical protein O9X90_25690 [Agrobacterium leguminum]|uniref:hypothetical protein n=1 Tax=Agrobacterium leguminum TaxID=2792015 RepID=UPI0022B81F78|nr:hypothetical protein [Agrobacterium leguminum]MCZ7935724.1 hypothetical protein [Agrobacterium leguminum]
MHISFSTETDAAAIMSARHRFESADAQRSYGALGKTRNHVTSKEQNECKQPVSVTRCAVKLSHEHRFKVTRVNGVLMFIRMLGDGT